ncbi:hypothetical protein E2562_013188 [Oryza meyeriana var. granulata]|uniref:Uncharacterized protein n=1 Tax=Oryza meyeriana var. granulata TaxID=110450 RepID=A0A6G1DHF5_9ORYZ|nr:hypothetical protein E2562_013188 [Oryza meyeriana var. granulata]
MYSLGLHATATRDLNALKALPLIFELARSLSLSTPCGGCCGGGGRNPKPVDFAGREQRIKLPPPDQIPHW